jgi:hypothetical protein
MTAAEGGGWTLVPTWTTLTPIETTPAVGPLALS